MVASVPLSNPPSLGHGLQHPAFWIALYFGANLALTVHSKWVLSRLHFAFPWLLSAMHIAISSLGSYLMLVYYYKIKPPPLSWAAEGKLLMFSTLYAVNIAISNISLARVSLSLHQIIRSATPAFVVATELVLFAKTRRSSIYLPLALVISGIILATLDEFSDISFTAAGLLLTFAGAFLSSLKGIVTNIIMVGPLKMHPLEVIWRMGLASTVQCVLLAALFGELPAASRFLYDRGHSGSFFSPASLNLDAASKLLLNAVLAMWLNWISFAANYRTSALTMTVAGNLKQAISIVLSVYIFGSRVSATNMLGVVVSLLGGAWYR